MSLYFNPLDEKCKNIIGAIKDSEEVRFTVFSSGNAVKFRVLNDDTKEIIEYEAVKNDDAFTLTINSLKAGLYFYHIICDGEVFVPSSNLTAVKGSFYCDGYQLLVYSSDYKTPHWLKGGTIYQIFPDRFCRSKEVLNLGEGKIERAWGETPYYKPNSLGKILNNDFFGGDLKGIESKADYLKDLGVTAVYLNPITKAYSNHRYDTANYLEIDEVLGSEDDFKSLCKTLHEKGIKVILDGVYNHTGDDSVYFNKYGKYPSVGAYQSKDSKYYNWYTFQSFPEKYTCWWDINILPTINKNSVEFEDFIAGNNGVIEKYLSLGADGFRLDVVDEIPDSFVKKIRKAIKENSGDGILIGEVWEDATNKIAYDTRRKYFQGEELDSVMNYPLKNAIIGFVKTGDSKIIEAVVSSQINNYPNEALNVLMNMLGTHDTARILTVLGFDEIPKTRDEMVKMKLSEKQKDKAFNLLKLAIVLQFTLYGVPSIYYADEIGEEGGKDPFNRTCFNWNFNDFNKKVLNFYQKISSIRRENDIFIDGTCKIVKADNGLFAFTRQNNHKKLLVMVNLGEYKYKIKSEKGLINLFDDSQNKEYDLEKNSFLILSLKG